MMPLDIGPFGKKDKKDEKDKDKKERRKKAREQAVKGYKRKGGGLLDRLRKGFKGWSKLTDKGKDKDE